jgi:hypothetical protein
LQCAVVQVIIILVAEYLISLGTGVILLDCEDLYLHDNFVNSFLCYMLHNILIFCFSSLDKRSELYASGLEGPIPPAILSLEKLRDLWVKLLPEMHSNKYNNFGVSSLKKAERIKGTITFFCFQCTGGSLICLDQSLI